MAMELDLCIDEWILEAISWVLLGFLVERLISLIVSLSEEDSKSLSIEQQRTRQSATVDHCDDDDHDEEMFGMKLASVIFSVVEDDSIPGSIIEERIEVDDHNEHVEEGFQEEQSAEFVDQADESVEYQLVDDDIRDGNLGLKERDSDESNVIVEGIVDDERKGENSSNVDDEGETSGRELKKDQGILSDDEDWEGIERSELERRFAVTMNLIDEEPKLFKGGNDVIIQLYGLQKIAMEGPCHEPQPMPLKLSARAKWNAWKKLGNMSPEDAMEQYINLIAENRLEGVKDDKSSAEIIKTSSLGAAVDSNPGPN